MALEAWVMEESDEDQRLPHQKNPNQVVPLTELEEIGVLYWHLDPKKQESGEELEKIRETRGYSYMDYLELCPGKVDNYEEKLKNFYREHIHADEEIRYCLEGSGYFDIRGKDDRWIRIWIKEGDMIVLPAGIYHRFTLDTSNYVKLMRLFVGEPVWTAYNRPQEDHPARQGYVKNLLNNSGVALEAH
uniref:Acireductone dioxygenase n=1 Tax=Ananas comosus var. bracteatus TaxID=296719 RepID=A0A6V7QSW9_ANACO